MKESIYRSRIYRCDGVPILKIKIHSSSNGELEAELCRNAEEFASGMLLEDLSLCYRANEDANKRFYFRYVYTFSIAHEDAFDGKIRFLKLSASLVSEKQHLTVAKGNETLAVNLKSGDVLSANKLLKVKNRKNGKEIFGVYKRIVLEDL